MLFDIAILLFGLAILLFTGDILVRGAVGLAQKLQIPPLIIGLTIVALGTSAPELVVSVRSASEGFPGLALGNVIGSNIANILMVLGIPAMMAPMLVADPRAKHNGILLVIITVIFTILLFLGPLQWWHALILIALMIFFLADNAIWAIRDRKNRPEAEDDDGEIEGVDGVPSSYFMIFLFIASGLVGLPVSADLTVNGAAGLASSFGISDAVIGLTIVALGTSLPELAATIAAVRQGEHAMGVGNIIGSNIFNMVAIIGITAAIHPLSVPPQLLSLDIWIMGLTTLAVLPFVIWRHELTRKIGFVFTTAYIIYIISNFVF